MFVGWGGALRVAVYVYAAGSFAAGVLDLIFGNFEPAHQPIQAFGDHIPGREMLAYIAAVWLIAGGAAILWRRTARAGAWALATIYLIFAAFWLPRFYTAPHVLGFGIELLIGLLGGVAQQLILVAAAANLYASLAARELDWLPKARLLTFTHPRNHVAWGSNAYNLAAVGATWIFAESIAARRRHVRNDTQDYARSPA